MDMKYNVRKVVGLILVLALSASPGICLSDNDVLRLKKHGIQDETLALLVREKIVVTCAMTVDEVIGLKQSGISDETLRLLIREKSFMKNTDPIVYGTATLKPRPVSVQDIIRLKKEGVSEEIIGILISESASSDKTKDAEKAWQMLENMNLRLDQR